MTWTLDPSHSSIEFAVRHMMIAKVRGAFARFRGELSLDPQDLTASKVSAEIEVASISTGDDKRDAHLRSGDFFDAEQHPTLRFESGRVTAKGDRRYLLEGQLTIRGATRPVTFEVEVEGPAKDPWGNQRLGFSLRGAVDREDFGLTWNQALEAGGVLVGKKVEISAEIQAVAS